MDKDLFNSDDYKINDDLTNGENNDVVVNKGNVSKDMINVSESKKNVVNSGLKKENKSVKKNEMNVKNNNTSIVLIMSILLSFVCGMLGAYLMCKNVTVEQVVKNITTSELVENSISSSVDKVYDSTVVVIAYANDRQISTGTGFIYKIDGGKAYILTNNHVINDADKVEIEFNDNNDRVSGTIIGGDTYADIAVLTIDNSDYVAVEFGDVSTLKLGDTIFTVGSPMGINYKGTVTKGILSGKERMVEVNLSGNTADYYMKVLQLDAAVNPGNSGGPLCDVSGKVIGIISLKIVQDEVEGMGFAIPIEDALKYANLIEEGGEVSRPYIGISMLDLTEEYYLWQNKITIPEGVEEGIAIISVEDDSPAKKAGLKKGDIITKINDQDTGSLAEFRYELYKYQVGEKIEVTFYRDGKVNSVNVTLGKNKG